MLSINGNRRYEGWDEAAHHVDYLELLRDASRRVFAWDYQAWPKRRVSAKGAKIERTCEQ